MTTFEQKHGRPKPPRIKTEEHDCYLMEHDPIIVWCSDWPRRWWAESRRHGSADFLTHAEAVQYAHKLAQERNTN